MDTFELNKIVGGCLATLMVLFFIDAIGNVAVSPHDMETVAYPVPAMEGATDQATAATEEEEPPLAALLASADADKGKKTAKKCAACHTFEEGGKKKVGPNLWNIIGRDMASSVGFSYSSALSEAEGAWGYAGLDEFLTSPKNYMPGNKMTFPGLKKAVDRANVIAFLRMLSDSPQPLPSE